MKPTEEQELLIARYLAGTATAEEHRQLDAWLRADPDARGALLAAASQEVQLFRVFAAEQGRVAAAADLSKGLSGGFAVPTPSATGTRPSARVTGPGRRPAATFFVAGAAAVVVFVAGALTAHFTVRSGQAPTAVAEREPSPKVPGPWPKTPAALRAVADQDDEPEDGVASHPVAYVAEATPRATFDSVVGRMAVVSEGVLVPATTGSAIVPDQVVVGSGPDPGTRAHIAYADGTRLKMLAGSMTVPVPSAQRTRSRSPGELQVTHMRGFLRAIVTGRPERAPFRVMTPLAEVSTSRAGLFAVWVAPESTWVNVREGTVRLTLTESGESIEVNAGQEALARPDRPLAARPSSEPAGDVRVKDGILALYTFRENGGQIVHDVSGVRPLLDLDIGDVGAVHWVPSGLELYRPTLAASPSPAAKISRAVRASNEITVEAWISPSSVAPRSCKKLGPTCPELGPGRIVTLSSGLEERNFLLGQGDPPHPGSAYSFRLRTTSTNPDGWPTSVTREGTVEPRLTHVVYTRDATGRVRSYVQGTLSTENPGGGDLSSWRTDLRFGLGNELGGLQRPWLGVYHLVAVYGRALRADEITKNFKAGPPAAAP